MILTAKFETHEMVPPQIWAQCRHALAHVLQGYGFDVKIREDRGAEMEANMRFFAWVAEQRLNEFPQTPADAEVK